MITYVEGVVNNGGTKEDKRHCFCRNQIKSAVQIRICKGVLVILEVVLRYLATKYCFFSPFCGENLVFPGTF